MIRRRPSNPLYVLAIATFVLLLMSFIPWASITKNYFKDFNIFEDICTTKTVNDGEGEIIDPELLALMSGDNLEDLQKAESSNTTATTETTDLPSDSIATVTDTIVIAEPINPRVGDLVVVEDYTPNGSALSRFARAIKSATTRPVRIAMIGDSYIEGDVFSQDLREKLQTLYGGRGAGYMMMHTDIPGFRRSVSQTDNGWTSHDIRHVSKMDYKWLAGEYFTGNSGAVSTYKGVKRLAHANAWNNSKFLFVSPKESGSITLTTDSGSKEFTIKATDSVQCISIDEETSRFTVKNNVQGLIALGVWLNDNSGVSLDCMSLRGNSGISHRKLNHELAHNMSDFISYDLIIVEYGINALSSAQKDYSKYGKYMEEVISELRRCYPQADILMLGIGDRGQKNGSEVHSISTAQNMVDTQRDVARRTGIAFWDTREAMGGNDAVVVWRERKLVNADYIHLNHKGGEVLAQLLVDALSNAILSK